MSRLPHHPHHCLARPLLLLPPLVLCLVIYQSTTAAAESPCPTVLPNPPHPRIVGGQPAPPQLAVFLAALFNQRARFRCSATILAPGWLLTARHCNVSTDWTAVLSTADRALGSPQRIAAVTSHPSAGERFDLTLVQLESTPAPLPVPPLLLNSDPSAPRVASFARTAGYGRRDYDDPRNTRLRQVDVPIVDNPDCEAAYGASVVDGRVCAGYSAGGCDSCTGDSGGPLLQYDTQLRPVLLAVVSAGKNCALPGFPGLYAPIQPVLGWLRDHVISFETGTPSDSASGQAVTDGMASPSPSTSPLQAAADAALASESPAVVAGGDVTVSASASPVSSAANGDAPLTALPPPVSADSDSNTSTNTSTNTSNGSVDVSGSGTENGGDGSGDAVASGTQDGASGGDGGEVENDGDGSDGGTSEDDGTTTVAEEDAAPAAAPATASPSAGSSEAARQNGSGGLSGGSVAGIAVAGVAVGVVLVVASVCYVMMPRRTDAAVAV